MTEITINNRTLIINGESVELPNPIESYLQSNGYVIILLERREDKPARDNIWAFDMGGNLVWKAQQLEAPATDANPYIDIWMKEGEIWARDFKGMEYKLDPETGKHLDSKFRK